jgi:hypothetical protein
MHNKRLVLLISLLLSMLVAGCSAVEWEGIPGAVDISGIALVSLQAVIAIVMLVGLFSLILVVVPGLTVIWLAALIYGILTGFDFNSGLIFLAITISMIFGNMLDQILMGARAKRSGASWTGVLASMAAAFLFSILFPPFGGLVAALIVLFTIETVRLRNWRKAGESTREMAVGCASAVLARFATGVLMIGLWALWLWLSGDWPF